MLESQMQRDCKGFKDVEKVEEVFFYERMVASDGDQTSQHTVFCSRFSMDPKDGGRSVSGCATQRALQYQSCLMKYASEYLVFAPLPLRIW